MFKNLKHLYWPARPTPEDMVASQLNDARLDQLEADAAAEHWNSKAAMLRERVQRLQNVQSASQGLLKAVK